MTIIVSQPSLSLIVLGSVAAALRLRPRHLHKISPGFGHDRDVFQPGQRLSINCAVGFGRGSNLDDNMGKFHALKMTSGSRYEPLSRSFPKQFLARFQRCQGHGIPDSPAL